MRFRGIGCILGFAALWAPSYASAACGDEARSSAAYQALEACDQRRVVEGSDSAARALKALQAAGICVADSSLAGNSGLHARVCRDPGGFVCDRKGRVLDSQCRLSNFNLDDFGNSPEAVAAKCSARAAGLAALGAQRSLCESDSASEGCRAAILSRHEDVSRAEHDAVFTSSRRATANRLFERVRDRYVAMIQASTRIPAARREALKSRISATLLNLDRGVYCGDGGLSSSGNLPTGAYNFPAGGHNEIEICIGTMANLDRMNPYALMWVLAHELSHSIDPCALEQEGLTAVPATGTPHVAESAFPGLVGCLRGGSGGRGCTGAVIRCNEVPAADRRQICIDEVARSPAFASAAGGEEGPSEPAQPSEERISECLLRMERTPSCPIHASHDHHKSQLPEAFCDFMGAEVVGRLIEEDAASGALDGQGRLDALASISAADGSGSASSCQAGPGGKYATMDRYARGHTRVNRLLMGSSAFRAAVGCSAAPATADGGVTCSGF